MELAGQPRDSKWQSLGRFARLMVRINLRRFSFVRNGRINKELCKVRVSACGCKC